MPDKRGEAFNSKATPRLAVVPEAQNDVPRGRLGRPLPYTTVLLQLGRHGVSGNNALLNQAIAAMYQHLHCVSMWLAGPQCAVVNLCFQDTSAQHRQHLASAGSIQLTMYGAAGPVSLPISTVASKQLPDVTVVRVHNVLGDCP